MKGNMISITLSVLSLILHEGRAFTSIAPLSFHGHDHQHDHHHDHQQQKQQQRHSIRRSFHHCNASSRTSTTYLQLTSASASPFDITSAFDEFAKAQGLISPGQSIEAEICSDAAHLLLDFATVFSPDTIYLRLLISLGRVFSIMSDYIPDHSITPDELVIQSTLLGVSLYQLVKKSLILISSFNESTSFKDRRIFQSIFYPSGLTYIQYKTLLALNVIGWEQVPARSFFLEDKESFMIVYHGELYHYADDSNIVRYGNRSRADTGTSAGAGAGSRSSNYEIIGRFPIVNRLKKDKKVKMKTILNNQLAKDETPMERERILRAGSTDALFLRINTTKLTDCSKIDDSISDCILNLYLNAMQEQLSLSAPVAVIPSVSSPPAPNATLRVQERHLTKL